jgi:putative ABC transport system permease protein
MRSALWLAFRELIDRKVPFAVAVVAIAAAVAICASTDLVSRSRQVAVSAELDHMGPGLRVLPAGVSTSDLSRFEMGPKYIPPQRAAELVHELSPWTRAVEGRLLMSRHVGRERTPVIGVAPDEVVSPFKALHGLEEGKAVLGAELARRLDKGKGDALRFDARELQVHGVLPSTATAEDLALFLTREELQELAGLPGMLNEIRLYPLDSDARQKSADYLELRFPYLKVVVPDRDDAVRPEAERSLGEHRWILYLLTAMIATFGVLVWAHLNASERQVEMATIVAIGGSSHTILGVLGVRAAIVALAGGILGSGIGAAIALGQDFDSARHVVWSWNLVLWPVAAIVLSIMGALPVTLFSAKREHVHVLQQ